MYSKLFGLIISNYSSLFQSIEKQLIPQWRNSSSKKLQSVIIYSPLTHIFPKLFFQWNTKGDIHVALFHLMRMIVNGCCLIKKKKTRSTINCLLYMTYNWYLRFCAISMWRIKLMCGIGSFVQKELPFDPPWSLQLFG